MFYIWICSMCIFSISEIFRYWYIMCFIKLTHLLPPLMALKKPVEPCAAPVKFGTMSSKWGVRKESIVVATQCHNNGLIELFANLP